MSHPLPGEKFMGMRSRTWLSGVGRSMALLIALPSAARAQSGCVGWDCPALATRQWRVDARLAAANAGLGAATVVISALARHRSLSWKDVVWGATGGVVTFAGKGVATAGTDGSGLLGRQIAGIGSALVYNVGRGEGPFDRVSLEVGPVRLLFEKGGQARVLVDATSLIAAVYIASSHEGARLDLGRSLSSGALVFLDPGIDVPGCSLGSVIMMRSREGVYDDQPALEHETVHVIQSDQLYWYLTADPDHWLAEKLVPDAWAGHVVPGLHVLLIGGVGRVIAYDRRPWEIEAYRITGR